MRLEERVAIVTGSGQGIGAETVRSLSREGARVVVADIVEENARKVKDEIERAGGEALALKVDVTDRESVKQMMKQTKDVFGSIDILVNNAGFPKDTLIQNMPEEDFDAVINVCLKGSWNCCQAVVDYMIPQKYGKIINISSRAHWGTLGQTNYSSAKAGIIGLTRSLSKEVGKHNINVNAIAPGMIETEGISTHPRYDDIKERAIKNTPLRRVGQPSDIANIILFLATDESSFITGELIHVSGGRFSG
jgi:3-oxoacyl-[acyl-carrier protein] reductase